VRHVAVDGLRVILDLQTASYSVLDDTASALWPVLTGECGADDAFADAAALYDLDRATWQASLAAFTEHCLAGGLLVAADVPLRGDGLPLQTRGATYLWMPATLRAAGDMLATRRMLAQHGFRRAYAQLALPQSQLRPRPRPRQYPRQYPLGALLKAFGRAENLFIHQRAPRDCLPRSLSLYRFLRSFGVSAEHVIGVRRLPFQAHAWVEHQGAPLLEGCVPAFTPIARLNGAAA
jgi:hypothetical protein